MNNYLKHQTISVLLCSVIILLNTDLACLRPYFTKVSLLLETRKNITKLDEQKYAVVIPDADLLSVKKDVYVGMSKYVRSTLVDEATVNSLHTPQGVDCRGSPLNRPP